MILGQLRMGARQAKNAPLVMNKMLFDSDTKMMVNKMLSDTKVVVNKTFGMMPYTKVAETKMNSRWKSRWCAP